MQPNKNFNNGKRLPYCGYPSAADTWLHGLQTLPEIFPLVTMEAASAYRSSRVKIVTADNLNKEKLLQMAGMMASSFAISEPMARHVQPPKDRPAEIFEKKHTDPFGNGEFGHWTKENILAWVVRLFILTDPCSPLGAIELSTHVIKQSLAAVNDDGDVVGGALNTIFDISNTDKAMRSDDRFIGAILPFFEPISQFLTAQLSASLNAVCKKYPEFLTALKANRVGDLYMVARSPLLPSEDTFELVASTALHFQQLGFEYLLVSAGNQWTGAACEVLEGVRIHFAPYRDQKRVFESHEPIADKPSSIDGFISDKDSGCMLYAIRLK